MRKRVVVGYVTGHGFGHYTRSAAVLEALAARGVTVHLRTAAQALRLARRAAAFASVEEVDVGPGTAQRGPLEVDVPGTRAALQQHLDRWDATVAEEARFLDAARADLVFADVPPIAFEIAAGAVVPSVGMSNFPWSWIYEGYARDGEHGAFFARAAAHLRRAEARATLFLGLAMGGGLEVFPRVAEIAPVARAPLLPRTTARRAIADLFADRDDARPLVLASFGGFGAELDLRNALAQNEKYRFLVVSGPRELAAMHNARSIEPSDGGHAGTAPSLSHPDLVAAADCVLGKPGYGTVAECLAAATPFVHVPRGAFREAPPLVAAVERWLPSAPLALDDLYAGRWSAAIQRATTSKPPERAPAPDGIAQAVAHLERVLD